VSTPGRQVKSDCDVLDVIDTLIKAHQAQFERHKIEIDFNHNPKDGIVSHVVPGQIFQIFENLISNSVYWLSTRDSLQEGRSSARSTISIQYNVDRREIEFTDNGPGIEEADGDKVFDPFWSKKPASAGRGLGLYISKRLCDDNKIDIQLTWNEEEQVYSGFSFKFS
jgi:signal transduction histidine kinase